MNESTTQPAAELYLDLMKECLTRYIFAEGYRVPQPAVGSLRRWAYDSVSRLLRQAGLVLVKPVAFDAAARAEGLDHPPDAETMIGLKRLDNIQHCVTEVLRCGVGGDLIETGVWRGGVTIFMRAILKAYGVTDRLVWVADSFAGLPQPDPEKYPADLGDNHWRHGELTVSQDTVRANFAKYGLLDDQVRFLSGWFRDTLARAPIARLAVLRLDGDMYESTWQALEGLYHKVSVGGFVIVDDYYAVAGCRQAVEDFRGKLGIDEPIERIDRLAVFWRKRTMELDDVS